MTEHDTEDEARCACGRSKPGDRDPDGYSHGARRCEYTDVTRTDQGWRRSSLPPALTGNRWISCPCVICDKRQTHRLVDADGNELRPATCDECIYPDGTARTPEAEAWLRARAGRTRAPKRLAEPLVVMCLHCAAPCEDVRDGRPRKFCSTRCRVAAHRAASKRS